MYKQRVCFSSRNLHRFKSLINVLLDCLAKNNNLRLKCVINWKKNIRIYFLNERRARMFESKYVSTCDIVAYRSLDNVD